MSALSKALAYRRLVDEHAALRLLRADLAPVIAGILAERLGAPGMRMPTEELHAAVEADLEELRLHEELKQNARAYCDDWRNAGFLVRRTDRDSRGETYELSAAAHLALRMFSQLETPRTTITESRLVGLAAAIRQLARDTDPDGTRRLEVLLTERDRIDAEITAVRGGEVTTLDDRRAAERLADILLQAEHLPGDFAGVRARFESLNQDLRASILDADERHGSVLDDVFRGVDLIEASDEGRTFTAFAALIRDPERSAALDTDLAALLERDFARAIDPGARRALRTLVRDLKHGSRDVHQVPTSSCRRSRSPPWERSVRTTRPTTTPVPPSTTRPPRRSTSRHSARSRERARSTSSSSSATSTPSSTRCRPPR
nr:DUF3375 family protein [Aeromicrobium sp. REDSEA-S32_B7]